MYAYQETLTLNNLQQLTLSKPLTLPIGKKIKVMIIAEDETDDLDSIRNQLQQQGITEDMINEAIDWARA